MSADGRQGAETACPGATVGVSVVVPLGPEETAGAELARRFTQLDWPVEVLWVLAEPARGPPFPIGAGQRVLTAAPGRARQQNAGARAATGAVLWFVHADTRLPHDALDAIVALYRRQPATLGYFDLEFHDGPPWLALNAWGSWWRSRLFGLPFGDQGLFLARERFFALGGFDESLTLGEDLDFVVRARAAGLALRAAESRIGTSARKYRRDGWWRTTARHLWLTLVLYRRARQRIAAAAR
jgi:hypothetical protein